VNTQNGSQLYTVGPNGKAQLRPVQVGVSVDGMTEIRGGVTAADLIVFDGQSRLNPGVLVTAKVVPATPDTAADAARTGTVGDPS
jgi:multidrug efflux system membrane fusion protein